MNKIKGQIFKVQKSGAIMLVDVDVDGQMFSALLIDSGVTSDWVAPGNAVFVVFKETEISLAKNLSGLISLRNRMRCMVQSIKKGELLSLVSLDFKGVTITSAITTRSVDSLDLKIGEELDALVKANEVSLMKGS